MIPAIALYEEGKDLIRARFASESVLAMQVLDPRIDPDLLELFLICFSAFGVTVTAGRRMDAHST
jgi:hypothetical protein